MPYATPLLLEKIKSHKGTYPVPLVALAKDLGLEIFGTQTFPESKSGSLLHEDGLFRIYVNNKHMAERKRFTVAHEIAHFILHKDRLVPKPNDEHVDNVRTPLRALNYEQDVILSKEEQQMEIEANELALEILMPADDFVEIYNKAHSMKQVAEKFLVSESAVTLRAQTLLGTTLM